jgi:hypothetical protein
MIGIGNGGTGTATTFTQSGAVFAGASSSQDNSQFFWDDTNHWLGHRHRWPSGVVTTISLSHCTWKPNTSRKYAALALRSGTASTMPTWKSLAACALLSASEFSSEKGYRISKDDDTAKEADNGSYRSYRRSGFCRPRRAYWESGSLGW